MLVVVGAPLIVTQYAGAYEKCRKQFTVLEGIASFSITGSTWNK